MLIGTQPPSFKSHPGSCRYWGMDLLVGRGRVGRLAYVGTNVLLIVAAGLAYRLLGQQDTFTGEIELTAESTAAVVVTAWLSVMNAVRRLHDRSHSGLLVVFLFLPIANLALGLYLLFAPGNPGWNRFGNGAGGGTATPMDRVAHAEAVAAEAAARNEAFLNDDGSFDMDGLFRNSDIDRT